MEIRIVQREPVVVAELRGEVLDARNTKEFRSAIDPILESCDNLILDLGQVTFVDSSGLGALLACLRRLTDRGAELKLCGLTRPVRTLFELVRIHRIFEIYNTREEALQSYGATVPTA